MSIAFILKESDVQVGLMYVSDGTLRICESLEQKGFLPMGGGQLRFLDDKVASEGLGVLENAIAHLSDDGSDRENSFAATEGNAKASLSLLRDEILKHPNALVVAWR